MRRTGEARREPRRGFADERARLHRRHARAWIRDYWSPFLAGVGPAGAYAVSLGA